MALYIRLHFCTDGWSHTRAEMMTPWWEHGLDLWFQLARNVLCSFCCFLQRSRRRGGTTSTRRDSSRGDAFVCSSLDGCAKMQHHRRHSWRVGYCCFLVVFVWEEKILCCVSKYISIRGISSYTQTQEAMGEKAGMVHHRSPGQSTWLPVHAGGASNLPGPIIARARPFFYFRESTKFTRY